MSLRHALILAAAQLRAHPIRALVMILALAILVAVPLGLTRLLALAEQHVTGRAASTPLLLGPRGSAMDLTLASLYFVQAPALELTQADLQAAGADDLAKPIPLLLGATLRGVPVVGTTLGYLQFRGLRVAEGRGLAVLGEAVIGAEAARRQQIRPGDRLVTDGGNLFDLAGSYPLELHLTGILAPTGGPDDRAIFVDIKTGWVIRGIGHGHQLPQSPGETRLNAATLPFTRITEETLDSFHFHGDPAGFPVSSILALPRDVAAATLLEGRYLDQPRVQALRPAEVMARLLDTLLALSRWVFAATALVGLATATALGLALWLSVVLRAEQWQTLAWLGAGRARIAMIIVAELVLLLSAGIALGVLLAFAAGWMAEPLILGWLAG